MDDISGGFAFACAAENGHQTGMALLDYFAGQALAGLLAADARYDGKTDARDRLAADAYDHATAMVNRRAALSASDQTKEK